MDCSSLVGFVMEFYSTLTLAYQTHIQSQEKKNDNLFMFVMDLCGNKLFIFNVNFSE